MPRLSTHPRLKRVAESLTLEPHTFSLRVYYEDTDMAGIVYYANYLRFIERGRSEWVRSLGISQNALKDDRGIVFAVRHISADYLSPARLEDTLIVETRLLALGGARIDLDQRVLRGDSLLFAARVTLVSMALSGGAARLPGEIRAAMAAHLPQ